MEFTLYPTLLFITFALCASLFSPLAPRHALAQGHTTPGDEVIRHALSPVAGDLDEITRRGTLRMAIPYTPIYFSYDGEKLIGLAVELAREFEKFMLETQKSRIDVVLVPLPRNEILPAVIDGRADLAAANLTITPERAERVAFADPIFTDVSELVVTGPAAGSVSAFDDLAETGLYLRPSSSYYVHLRALNKTREEDGKQPIPITDADPHLEDYDLLDLMQAGVIAATVVDSHKLELWRKVFDKIEVHESLALNEGGEIAWALRKTSPRLLAVVNEFIAEVRQGTLIGNVLIERYLGSADWIVEIRTGDALKDYRNVVASIQTHAARFSFDWRMILAQAYQESKLDQGKKSDAGAVGVMQVLPSTAADPNVAVTDIHRLDANVEAGVKYLRFIRDRYFGAPDISDADAMLLALAAYNAGPRNVVRARERASKMGLDPNTWFSNVEVAVAKTVGREPVTYVRNIYKYFISFSLIGDKRDRTAAIENKKVTSEASGGDRRIILVVIALALMSAFLLWRRVS